MTTTALPTNLGLAGAAALDRPRFLVSFAFDAPDAAAAQVATDQLAVLMQTSDAVPAFPNLAAYTPVQVAAGALPVTSRKTVLVLDPGEASDLMAALMDAVEYAEEEGKAFDSTNVPDTYRALSDKLVQANKAARG